MARIGQTKEIQDFILNNVDENPKKIGRITAEEFDVSRPAVGKHLNSLIKRGLLTARGATKARTYELTLFIDKVFEIEVTPNLQEDVVWRDRIRLVLQENTEANNEVLDICHYGFTEMLNNVLDHSESKTVRIHVYINAILIQLYIIDFGVGIFRKIQKDFNLNDPRHALLELSKGKLTSDKSKHTGQGIFFTSRMFDKFSILSGKLYFERENIDDDDWLIEVEERSEFKGTSIELCIKIKAERTMKEIFDKYASEHGDYGFTKTHVPISLTKYDDDELVSRSAAKRLLARFDDFKEVWLDFRGVSKIGQAFADEIFRVFAISHPDVQIQHTNANADVLNMINRAKSALNEDDGRQMSFLK